MESDVPDARKISRQELYDKIWRTPAIKVASEFGISDVGLAKICNRHDIPKPPPGYWAKLAHGQDPPRPSLPQLDDESLNEIHFFRHSFDAGESQPKSDVPMGPRIVVPETLVDPHPLITVTRNALRSGERRANPEVHLNISVSRSEISRALLIFDTLIKEWERIGGTVSVGHKDLNGNFTTALELHGDKVPLELLEIFERDPTDKERSRWNRTYLATGRLAFQLDCYADAHRKKWADGKRQRVEEMLDQFIQGVIDVLDFIRQERLDNECIGRQKAKVEDVRDAAKKRVELEEQRRTELSRDARNWESATHLRSYLAALRAEIAGGKLRATDPEGFAKWLDWADWYVAYLDPLTPTPKRPEFDPPPTNLPIDQLDLTRLTRMLLPKIGIKDTTELHSVERHQIKNFTHRDYQVWNEICCVLEGLGYDVSGRNRGYY
jgi:hypothetical protein